MFSCYRPGGVLKKESLRYHDDDGHEDVALNLRSFDLYGDYFNPFTLSNASEFFLRRIPKNHIERFSLTWPASMQIYWNKRKPLHKKRIQLPQDCLGTPTWPPFHCFGTPIWPPWRHVRTLQSSSERKRKFCRRLFTFAVLVLVLVLVAVVAS